MTPNWANHTIWTGDNLPVMRGMNSKSVDLIYLDPPFNSNRNYEAPIGSKAAGASFKDAWTLDDVDVHEHGELADRNPAAYSVIEAARQSHSKGMMSYLIFMAVRLLEMRRLLRDTGSIYLHCDTTAGDYLKLLMDAIFGKNCWRNTIIWQRTNTHNDAKKAFPDVVEVILFYTMPDASFNPVYVNHSSEYVKKFYRHDDKDGRGPYQLDNMASPQVRPRMMYEWQGYPFPAKGWRYQIERMTELHEQGRIYYPTKADGSPDYSKRPRLKRYLNEQKGTLMGNNWTDIKPVGAHAKENKDYMTQKPLALLDRIIRASSNPGDMVFDPFCGCATSLVAADRLGREWAGIDLSPLAIKLVNERITEDRPGSLFGGAIALDMPPKRTDLGELPNYRTHRHRLYGEQEGICIGCDMHFPFKVMEVDHILPRTKGGTDHPDNLQLLCSACNRSKGGRTTAEWKVAQERARY